MSSKEKEIIGFSFVKIVTEQFAIIDESVKAGEQFGLQTQLRFGINNSNKILAIYNRFRFETKDRVFLIIETSSHFRIEENSWGDLVREEKNEIVFPKNFVIHLAMLSVGVSRGILHAKTENTVYNQLVLPAINIGRIIESDLILDLEEEEVVI